MPADANLLRQLPKVDALLRRPAAQSLCKTYGEAAVVRAVRAAVDSLREGVLSGELTALPSLEELDKTVSAIAARGSLPSLRPVINATGVVLHTNLGRACLSRRAAEAINQVATEYSTLEYDLSTGKRGKRYSHVEDLITALTGAEAALVVNNNAAAVLLVLTAMARGGEVVVSRGELVEIGGSFRVPEIMEQCGCHLREVGATNKTHLRDYQNAIGEQTRALMKVHTSNYRIVGFSESVPLADMVRLGHENSLPVIEDLGSGSLLNLEQFSIHGEPTVQDSVRAGVDVISFSGDKLLGGPQAGIIIGKRRYIEKLKIHPLNRAMRVDKLTLAALEATLRDYMDKNESAIPVVAQLGAGADELCAKAGELCSLIQANGVKCEVVPSYGQVGGGSVPTQQLPSWAVALSPDSPDRFEAALRSLPTPVIGYISRDRYMLDVRTITDGHLKLVADAVTEAMG